MTKEIYANSHSLEDFERNWQQRLNEFDRKRIDYIRNKLVAYKESITNEIYRLKGLQDPTSQKTA